MAKEKHTDERHRCHACFESEGGDPDVVETIEALVESCGYAAWTSVLAPAAATGAADSSTLIPSSCTSTCEALTSELAPCEANDIFCACEAVSTGGSSCSSCINSTDQAKSEFAGGTLADTYLTSTQTDSVL